jgi:hypothetical protein
MTQSKLPAAKTRKWRTFDTSLVVLRSKFADLPTETLDPLIDEAITVTRQAADHHPSVGAKPQSAAADLP